MPSAEFLKAREAHFARLGVTAPPPPAPRHEQMFELDPETLTGVEYINFIADHPDYEAKLVREHAA